MRRVPPAIQPLSRQRHLPLQCRAMDWARACWRRIDPDAELDGAARSPSGRRLAALDLGTNNCRLLVAEPAGPGFHVVDSFSRIVRLGEGLAATGELERARDAANAGRAQGLPADHGPAPGGARPLRRDRGLPPRQQRARVHPPGPARRRDRPRGAGPRRGGAARHAGLPAADRPRRRPAADARHRRRQHGDHVAGPARAAGRAASPATRCRCRWAWSRLSESFGGGATGDAYARMVAHAVERLAEADRLPASARSASNGPRLQMLGTSGTVTTLAAVHLGLRRYDRRKVDGISLPFAVIQAVSRDAARAGRCRPRRAPLHRPSTGPTSSSPAAPSSTRSIAAGRSSSCRSPTAACAKASSTRLLGQSLGPDPAPRRRGRMTADRPLKTRLLTARGRSTSSQQLAAAPAQRPVRPPGPPAGLARAVGVQAAGAGRALRSAARGATG